MTKAAPALIYRGYENLRVLWLTNVRAIVRETRIIWRKANPKSNKNGVFEKIMVQIP